MTKQDFIAAVQEAAPNASLIGAIERKYNVSFPESIAKILSVLPQGGFLAGSDLCRVMSTSEIILANETLHTDFVGKKLLPMLDLGDNIFVVFDSNRQVFGRFSLNDDLVYRCEEKLSDII